MYNVVRPRRVDIAKKARTNLGQKKVTWLFLLGGAEPRCGGREKSALWGEVITALCVVWGNAQGDKLDCA